MKKSITQNMENVTLFCKIGKSYCHFVVTNEKMSQF